MIKTDIELKRDIELELLGDPSVNSARIAVSVDNGAVSLLGDVDTYAQKSAAEHATKRVSGVRAVAQDLTIKLAGVHQPNDSEIAGATHTALIWDLVPVSVIANVEKGWVTLEGRVIQADQRQAAEHAIRHLTGISGVCNAITIGPAAAATNATSTELDPSGRAIEGHGDRHQ